MAVKVTFPNVKQPISDGSGYITKAHYDFLRNLWLRVGGNNDIVSDLTEESSEADFFIPRLSSKIRELEKRIEDLEKELSSLGC